MRPQFSPLDEPLHCWGIRSWRVLGSYSSPNPNSYPSPTLNTHWNPTPKQAPFIALISAIQRDQGSGIAPALVTPLDRSLTLAKTRFPMGTQFLRLRKPRTWVPKEVQDDSAGHKKHTMPFPKHGCSCMRDLLRPSYNLPQRGHRS